MRRLSNPWEERINFFMNKSYIFNFWKRISELLFSDSINLQVIFNPDFSTPSFIIILKLYYVYAPVEIMFMHLLKF